MLSDVHKTFQKLHSKYTSCSPFSVSLYFIFISNLAAPFVPYVFVLHTWTFVWNNIRPVEVHYCCFHSICQHKRIFAHLLFKYGFTWKKFYSKIFKHCFFFWGFLESCAQLSWLLLFLRFWIYMPDFLWRGEMKLVVAFYFVIHFFGIQLLFLVEPQSKKHLLYQEMHIEDRKILNKWEVKPNSETLHSLALGLIFCFLAWQDLCIILNFKKIF